MYCFVDALRDLDVRRLQAQLLLLLLLLMQNITDLYFQYSLTFNSR